MRRIILVFSVLLFFCNCANNEIQNSEKQFNNASTSKYLLGKWQGFVWEKGKYTEPHLFITFKENGKVIFEYQVDKNLVIEQEYLILSENVINLGKTRTDETVMRINRLDSNRMRIEYNNEKMIRNVEVSMITQCEFVKVQE